MGKVLSSLLAAAVLGPLFGVLAVVLVVAPANAQNSCLGNNLAVDDAAPNTLTVDTDGGSMTLTHTQLVNALTIIRVGTTTPGVSKNGITIALMAGLVESGLRMLDNPGAYPDSANFPHDGDGSDHDSLGIFQMRPQSGWGTVAELMDPQYQAEAFYGGPTGPNKGSPRGLLDIPHWDSLPLGAAAQAVEVSAYPDRYQAQEKAAHGILAALTSATSSTDDPVDDPAATAAGAASSWDPAPGTSACAATTGGLPGGDPGPGQGAGGGFAPNTVEVAQAVAYAEDQLGQPYVFGGQAPGGWDCSGLTMMAYRAAGVDIGTHSVTDQLSRMVSEGRTLPMADAERGDLLFWQEPDGSYEHVAIYLGGGMMIAAPQPGENVKIQQVWSTSDERLLDFIGRPTGTP
ncbi:C40 family peptidase [Gryllotalpicola reticulitermitis]|uniref:C40 family peptidase n=1 Tax=Gryllotalpicola reticulitermitis TaxID=1184153 RepID=A0ABV8Q9M2_9MICO